MSNGEIDVARDLLDKALEAAAERSNRSPLASGEAKRAPCGRTQPVPQIRTGV